VAAGVSDKHLQAADKLLLCSASEQGRAIASGLTTSEALFAAESAAIDRRNPELNAFVARVNESTVTQPKSGTPLSGCSFAVKDNIDVSGLPTRAGLKVTSETPAVEDAPVVNHLQKAGLRFTGKLNMSPMALGSSTHNPDFGHCYNPLRKGFSAGGSSGGAASAVAAGLVGIALGTDTMGSVRLPAAFCGIVGFKPTWGRFSLEGVTPLCHQLDHVGVLCRSVKDAAAAYHILTGSTSVEKKAKTIGYLDKQWLTDNLKLQPEVEAVYMTACDKLAAAGVSIEAINPGDFQLARVRRAGLLLSEVELLETLRGIYPEQKDRLPDDLVAMLDFGSAQPEERIQQARTRIKETKQDFVHAFSQFDAVLSPTCPHTAFDMSSDVPVDSADLTVIGNVLGAPAISLPLPAAEGGLPAGLQLMGRKGEDEGLLALALEVEKIV